MNARAPIDLAMVQEDLLVVLGNERKAQSLQREKMPSAFLGKSHSHAIPGVNDAPSS
jgi:hypothetical protein